MTNEMLAILEEEILSAERHYERKVSELENAVEEFKEWAKDATAYDIAFSTSRQQNIYNLRENILQRNEDLSRLKWILQEMKKEIEK